MIRKFCETPSSYGPYYLVTIFMTNSNFYATKSRMPVNEWAREKKQGKRNNNISLANIEWISFLSKYLPNSWGNPKSVLFYHVLCTHVVWR